MNSLAIVDDVQNGAAIYIQLSNNILLDADVIQMQQLLQIIEKELDQ